MAQIASWNGHTFEVSSRLIRSIRDLTLKGSCEAEDKTSGGQQYARRKNGKAAELSFTVGLSALLGVTDVRSEALDYVNEANEGASEYFYLGTQKLVAAKMMLTSAEVTEYVCMPGNADEWISCDVKLTFKQADNGGKNGSKGKGKKKKSNRSGGTRKKTFWEKTTDDAKAVIKAGKVASAIKLHANQSSGKNGASGGLAAARIAVISSKIANRSANSATKKNPTTGRTAGGSLGVKLKSTR